MEWYCSIWIYEPVGMRVGGKVLCQYFLEYGIDFQAKFCYVSG
jgi:hypothetical protein